MSRFERLRSHPLARRLPLLVLVAGGLWLWRSTEAPERELVWQLEGPGWQSVTAIEVQLEDPDGGLLKREEHFFPKGSPHEVKMTLHAPAGPYTALVLVRRDARGELEPMRRGVTFGESRFTTQRLWLSDAR